MLHRVFVVAAWACLALIAAATLAPIGLRPHVSSRGVEYLLAFCAAGLLFGLAYPRRLLLVAGLVLGSAVLLEALQFLTPDRHGRLTDLGIKLAGSAIGLAGAAIISRLSRPRI